MTPRRSLLFPVSDILEEAGTSQNYVYIRKRMGAGGIIEGPLPWICHANRITNLFIVTFFHSDKMS